MTGRHYYLSGQAPFVRPLAALCAGIVTEWNVSFSSITLWVALAIAFAGVVVCACFPFFLRSRLQPVRGTILMLFVTAFGGLLTFSRDPRNHPGYFGKYPQHTDGYVARLITGLTTRPKSLRGLFEIRYRIVNDSLLPASGKLFVYFKKTDSCHLAYGDLICFGKIPDEIRNNGNPGEFDYRRYCLFHGITHRTFLGPGDYVIKAATQTFSLQQKAVFLQGRTASLLKKHIAGSSAAGLAEALLIGVRDDLDPDLIYSYQSAGIVHIIAISGMHLGLVYWVLSLLLTPLSRWTFLPSGARRLFGALMLLTGLWSFAFVAGGQPSVMRSAWMFSFIALEKIVGRRSPGINSLAASAFLLLCIDPFMLWDAGSELSYCAVLGIMIFMKPIRRLFTFQSFVAKKLWDLISISLAAQVFTTPVSLYLFHQFPNYFLLANLVAVPLSSLVMLGSMLVVLLSYLPAAANFAGRIVGGIIDFLNGFVSAVAKLPGAVSRNIHLTPTELLLLYVIIICAAAWLFANRKAARMMMLMMITVFILQHQYRVHAVQRDTRMIVYNQPGEPVIDFISKGKRHTVGADGFPAGKDSLPGLYVRQKMLSFEGKRLILVDGYFPGIPPEQKIPVDILLFCGRQRIDVCRVLLFLSPQKILLAGNLAPFRRKEIIHDLDSLRIPFWDLSEKGAFQFSPDLIHPR